MLQPPPDAEEIARLWPGAVQFARTFREVFGDGVRLIYARNSAGDELKRREYPTKL